MKPLEFERLRPEDLALYDLQEQAHAALAARPVERVSKILAVAPALVSVVDHVCLYRHDFHAVRLELTRAVGDLRRTVWEAQRMHPEVTYRSAQVHAALQQIHASLDRLDRLLHSDPAPLPEPPP